MIDDIEIREATLDDIPEITSIFRDTVRAVNSRDYNEKQIEVWASGADDIDKWEERIKRFYFIVAHVGDTIVGFSYLTKGYYLDGLFVHKDFQRRTIASKLLRIIESQVSINGFEVIKSDVSITALPFFDSHFYEVEKKQKKSHKGMVFENYIVYKEL
ncbi:GNAT family N-acetyltransferase [Psychroserpens algicola]|uniref:GNAT family N-acetyltransferase n=1 Tax=Psychroserpens algicola TaxID=1719034 RepID=A0ABT0H6Y7_9FLAO|nr:GNAT family N-acetyltransferase [Psychroserpens algicola]MCK8480140.1 GNAT family N-acetyltransferase [Psychroserpens algicola]